MSDLSILMLIIFLGYVLGSIEVNEIKLGTSGILLVALVFGHFGYVQPDMVGQIGLIFFVGAVGYSSGHLFIDDLKSNGFTFLAIGSSVIILGALIIYTLITKFSLPVPLALGLLSGALTSTPALGASLEATGGSELVAAGYGMAYVFGVIGVILFVQIIPKLHKKNSSKEIVIEKKPTEIKIKEDEKLLNIDKYNLSMFSLALFLGIILGAIKVPLGNGIVFSLGISGGPLVMGLLFGHIGKVGKINLKINESFLSSVKEIGLMLFLVNAGLGAGNGFLDVLYEYGYVLFIYGAIITISCMLFGYFVARVIFKIDIKKALGSLTGAMTSTPALGTLTETFDGDASVGTSYAATYPLALILIVLLPQFLMMLTS